MMMIKAIIIIIIIRYKYPVKAMAPATEGLLRKEPSSDLDAWDLCVFN